MTMFEQVAEAINNKDYRTASKLLQQLKEQEANNPWFNFYFARLYEIKGKLATADKIYRQLLRQTTNPKLISQIRQGIQRILEFAQQQKQQELAQAKAEPGSEQLGVLILEAIAPEFKKIAAQQFAKIMEIDPYSAILQLPTRYWRLYRTGIIGELKFYVNLLKKDNIPCFYSSINNIKDINIYQVDYFESLAPKATIICQNQDKQIGTFSFNWSEVTQRVEGLIPLFEQSLEIDAKRNLYRKTKTLDYAQVCDLHLPAKKTILRFCDQNYQFSKGITFSPQPEAEEIKLQSTIRTNWNNLTYFFKQIIPKSPVWSNFTPFAETAIDFPEMLKKIEPNISLFRRQEHQNTPWDPAFQLYSCLVFLKNIN